MSISGRKRRRQGRQPLGGRWVRVIKAHIDRIGRERGRVVLVQFEQGVGEVAAIGLRAGIGIGLELVAARKMRQQR